MTDSGTIGATTDCMTDYSSGLSVHHIRSHRGKCTGRPRSQGGGAQERDGERKGKVRISICLSLYNKSTYLVL